MADRWFVPRAIQKTGPFSFTELRELAKTVGLLPTDMVIQEGTRMWQAANQIEGQFWEDADRSVLIRPCEGETPISVFPRQALP